MNSIASKNSVPAEPSANPVSPVLQFALLLSPMVMSCFFAVYALTGWVIEGREKLVWSIESPDVALWVGGGIIAFSVLVASYAVLRSGNWRHPLVISSLFHGVLSLLLIVSVFLCVRM